LRHELIPELQGYNPRAKEILMRTAEVLAGDWAVVEGVADQAWQAVLLEISPGACSVDQQKLVPLQVGLQRAILRRMLNVLRPGLRDIDFETVERGVRFLRHPTRSRTLDLVQGLRLTWETDRLILTDQGIELVDKKLPWISPGTEMVLEVPGQVFLGDDWVLVADLCYSPPGFPAGPIWEAWLKEDALLRPLIVRTARTGERFQPFGLHGRTQKLSDFWINEGLPRSARKSWPLVCTADQIVWIPGYRIAESVRVTETGRQVVHLHLYRGTV
jgi:tRNA(Ile)-lysidine synthase